MGQRYLARRRRPRLSLHGLSTGKTPIQFQPPADFAEWRKSRCGASDGEILTRLVKVAGERIETADTTIFSRRACSTVICPSAKQALIWKVVCLTGVQLRH